MPEETKAKKTLSPLIFIVCAALMGGILYMTQPPSTCCPLATQTVKPAAAAPAPREKPAALPTLLELGSKKCIPCQMMMPVIAGLEKEYAGVLEVNFVDVWLKENVAIAEKYKINSIPIQIFLAADGKELWRHTGYISKDDILKKWKELGYDLPALKKTKTAKPQK